MIDEKIKNVFVGIAGNHVKSLNSHGTHGIKDNEVSNWDLEKLTNLLKLWQFHLINEFCM